MTQIHMDLEEIIEIDTENRVGQIVINHKSINNIKRV